MCDGWNSLWGSVRLRPCFSSSGLYLPVGCPGLGAGSNNQFIHPSDQYLLNTSHVPDIVLGAGDWRVHKCSQLQGNTGMQSIQQTCIGSWKTETNKNEKNDNWCIRSSSEVTNPWYLRLRSFTEEMAFKQDLKSTIRDYQVTKMKAIPGR